MLTSGEKLESKEYTYKELIALMIILILCCFALKGFIDVLSS